MTTANTSFNSGSFQFCAANVMQKSLSVGPRVSFSTFGLQSMHELKGQMCITTASLSQNEPVKCQLYTCQPVDCIITGVTLSMKQTGRVMIVSLVHKLFCYNLAFPSFCYRLACMCLKSSIFLVTGLALTTMGIVLAATTFPSPTVFAF